MVLDKIENGKLYTGLGERIAKAFTWLNDTDLSVTPSGRCKIDGDDVFALVQEYDTKEIWDGKLEGHRRYIDIQYIVAGTEQIGVALLDNQDVVEANEDDDCTFYAGNSNLVTVEAGMFAIFFPDDLHMPGIKVNQVSKVKKVIIKVQV